MASLYFVAVLAIILVLQSCPASSDVLSPIFDPLVDNLCKEVQCGKGTCKASGNGTFGFACECEPGWKQARLADDDAFKFMPCVIPNCTLDFSCQEGPAPAQEKDKRANETIFDPCYWADCGGGKCNKTSPFTHKCECNPGYANLLNTTVFPCYKTCALGMDCANLGIGLGGGSSPPPSLPDKSDNNAASSIRRGFNWLIVAAALLAMLSWR